MSIPIELVRLLTEVSNNLEDHTVKLATADWCQENDYHSLEWLLRHTASEYSWYGILFTGSRCYGKPREDSDFDWVMYCSLHGAAFLCENADQCSATLDPEGEHGRTGIDTGLRFGPLNVIVVTTKAQWQAWNAGTAKLKQEAPVTRERAVEVFQEAFTTAGLELASEEFSGDSPDEDYDNPWFEYDYP